MNQILIFLSRLSESGALRGALNAGRSYHLLSKLNNLGHEKRIIDNHVRTIGINQDCSRQTRLYAHPIFEAFIKTIIHCGFGDNVLKLWIDLLGLNSDFLTNSMTLTLLLNLIVLISRREVIKEQLAERIVVNLNEVNLYSAWECSINVSNLHCCNFPIFVYILPKKVHVIYTIP